jgi:hypothetical protein
MSIDYLLCMLPGLLIVMAAGWYVKSAYAKWSKVATRSGMTGHQAAQRLAAAAGLEGLKMAGVAGQLTDNYDPRTKTLNLSQEVAQSPSVASIAVAAHELGHAQQDAQGYLPLRFRSAIVPMVKIGSSLGWIMIIGGIALYSAGIAFGVDLAWLGVVFFGGGALFALATLPVELNASKRARQLLTQTGIVTSPDEERGVRTVLNAAAWTYVGALVSALTQLLYYASMLMGMGRRRS